jgi:anti-sigma factor RsiW
MTCDEVRTELHDYHRRRLAPALQDEVAAHLAACADCARVQRAEQALDELLERRLPRHPAPRALHRRLEMLVGRPAGSPSSHPTRRWAGLIAPVLAAGVVLAAGALLVRARGGGSGAPLVALTAEVVNDHLRLLASQHPLDVESGGRHQVKPWFEGKLDFAPDVPAAAGTDLRLRGGAVGYVFDRKAAVLSYGLRLHAVTLLVFRAEGLGLPDGPTPRATSARGFHVLSWRRGELGYALVSDAAADELAELGARLAAETGAPAPR